MSRTTVDGGPADETSSCSSAVSTTDVPVRVRVRVPVLVAASHGTSCCAGDGAVRALVAAVIDRAEAAGGPPVAQAFVDVQQPDVPAALRGLADRLGDGPDAGPDAAGPDAAGPGDGVLGDTRAAIIVPLLLSAGYHVRVDLAQAADTGEHAVVVAGALGPDDALIRVLMQRLDAAGLQPSDAVVLIAAGSSDPLAVTDCRDTAVRLGAALRREVRIGFLSAASPTVPEAISAVRQSHPQSRVVASTYLLAPGYFAELVLAAGADVVTGPLLPADGAPPTELVDIILNRYAAALEMTATSTTSTSTSTSKTATSHPVTSH